MDEKDIRILTAIARDGTASPDEIEDATGIPKSTVHYRLNQLREAGVIENDLYDIDLEKVGLSITLISEIWAEFGEGYHDTVGEKLAAVEGVNQVYFTMGDTDFVVIAHLANREMVETLVEDYEAIDEIERTSSKFVITTVKDEQNPLNDFDVETLVTALAD
ncbi:Lrp/AsnC family transcriptional regulator [Natrinema sp. 1APR25-10V2]|uniref:Lrp/AsnC family transcriptional regulator n=1 Tax=Natrinema sp. 1APR25-10V2 TaxID=2951081 RepID=UPI0028741677|nr:Lrp/AsnC family transcriptional regulator [Natrinema sp. 1APR25-10V2]MDS0473800.1 Lrp/AsnC family transcriptional regulator [Natrinema sp. 1APR25-10V2]